MTSSLVGSEMCIRDSLPAIPSNRQDSRRRVRGGDVRCARGSAARLSQSPVSYTHLTLPTICSV
eukprot:6210655-Prorocentrum_lima.AAC.1